MVSSDLDFLGRTLHFVGPKVSAYIIEFIGTFFLVLSVALSNHTGNPFAPLAPLAIGSTLMVMIFMGGHISGAHYNPSVTFGVRLTGRDHINTSTAFIYVIVQLLGSISASLLAYAMSGDTFEVAPGPKYSLGQALLVEVVFTFALVSVMLNSATTKSQNSNSFFGLAIGFTVLAGACSGGSISGGAFNPAVGTGPNIIHTAFGDGNSAKYIWLYWVGPLLGSALASFVFRITNTSEYRRAAAIASGKSKEVLDGYTPIHADTGDEVI